MNIGTMSIFELLFFSAALSMDAFAVAICLGISLPKFSIKNALIIGLYFGVFQAVMPLLGFLLGGVFAERITAYDHWIAFGLLLVLGIKMIYGSFQKDEHSETVSYDNLPTNKPNPIGPAAMLPFAIATSVDALAAGVSFAFMRINIVPAVVLIGVITFTVSALGVRIGGLVGTKFKSLAEFVGGVVLILLGVMQLL